jgi:hypothetical protein
MGSKEKMADDQGRQDEGPQWQVPSEPREKGERGGHGVEKVREKEQPRQV